MRHLKIIIHIILTTVKREEVINGDKKVSRI